MIIKEANERIAKSETKVVDNSIGGNKDFSGCIVTIIYNEIAKHLYLSEQDSITLNQCLEKVNYQYENDENSDVVMVIVEYALNGEIYEFGNYSDGKWYKHGTTRGYA